jgi:hypothetical protein
MLHLKLRDRALGIEIALPKCHSRQGRHAMKVTACGRPFHGPAMFHQAARRLRLQPFNNFIFNLQRINSVGATVRLFWN